MTTTGPLTRRYAANTLANVALRITSVLAWLWAARRLVDLLGPVEFGLFTLSAACAGYVAFLAVGLPSGLVRRVADLRGRGEAHRIRGAMHTALRLFAAVGAAGAVLIVAFVGLGGTRLLALPPEFDAAARGALLATAVVGLFSWPLTTFAAVLTGLQRIPALNIALGASTIASALAAVAVARAGYGVGAVVLATGGVLATAGLAAAALVRRELRGMPTSASSGFRAEARPLLSFGAWVLALEIAALLIYQTDQVLLGVFVSVESLTAYYIVARLHNLLRESNSVLGSALFPMIAEEEARGNAAAAEHAIYSGTRYAAALLAPATVVTVLLAEDFLRIWMGAAAAGLAPLARAFAAYWMIAVLTAIPAQVAMGRGEAAVLGKIALFCAGVNLVVSLALVRRYGITGVVTGTLVAYGLGIPLQVAVLFRKLKVNRRRFLFEVVAPVYLPLAVSGAVVATVLGFAPAARGIADLAMRGVFAAAVCWLPLWWTAVAPRDRARILGQWRQAG